MCLNGVSKWTVLKISCKNRQTQIKSEFQLQNAGYCKLLLTYRYTISVSAVVCSRSVQVLSVDPGNHFHTERCKLAAYAMYVQRKILASLRSQFCSGKPTVLTLTNSKQCGNVVRTKGTGHNNITNLIIQQINNDTTNKRITSRKDIITFTTKSVTHLDWLHVGAAIHKAKLI